MNIHWEAPVTNLPLPVTIVVISLTDAYLNTDFSDKCDGLRLFHCLLPNVLARLENRDKRGAHRELSEPMSPQSAWLHPPKQAALCSDPSPSWTTAITSALGIHTYPFYSSIRARAVTAGAVIQVLTVSVLYDLCWIAYVQTAVSICLVVEPQDVSEAFADPNTLLHTNWTLLNPCWSAIERHVRCLSICNQSECRIISSRWVMGCTTGDKLLPNSASGQSWKLQ